MSDKRFPICSKHIYEKSAAYRRLLDYFVVVSIPDTRIRHFIHQFQKIRPRPTDNDVKGDGKADAKDILGNHLGNQEPIKSGVDEVLETIRKLAKPKILSRCPVFDYMDYPLPKGISTFAFPNGVDVRTADESAESPKLFSFVLTNVDGKRQFGACLTFYEMVSIDGQSLYLEGSDEKCSTLAVAKALVLVSHHPYFNQMEDLLKLIFRISICKKYPYDIERLLWLITRDMPLPIEPTNRLDFELHKQIISFKGPSYMEKLPILHCNFGLLFELISHEHIVAAFNLLIQEHKLVIVSKYCSVLVHCSEALRALLYPLEWQSVYIPLLPTAAKNVLSAPVPFFIGMTEDVMTDMDEPISPEVAILNVDNGVLEMPNPAPLPLPKKLHSKLMNALLIHDTNSGKSRSRGLLPENLKRRDDAFPFGTDQIRLDLLARETSKESKSESSRLLNIRTAFHQLLEEVFVGFQKYVVAPRATLQTPDADNECALFKDNGFVRSRPSSLRGLTKRITQTMAFGEFVQLAFAKPNDDRVVGLDQNISTGNMMVRNTLSSLGKLWNEKRPDENFWELKECPRDEEDWFTITVPSKEYLVQTNAKEFNIRPPLEIQFPKLDKDKFFGPSEVLSFSKDRSMGFAFLGNRVQLVHAGSPADQNGMRVGWLLMSIDNRQAPLDQKDLMNLIVHRRRKHKSEPMKLQFATMGAIGKAQTPFGEAQVMSTTNDDGIACVRLPFGLAYIHFSHIKIDFGSSGMEEEFCAKYDTKRDLRRSSSERQQSELQSTSRAESSSHDTPKIGKSANNVKARTKPVIPRSQTPVPMRHVRNSAGGLKINHQRFLHETKGRKIPSFHEDKKNPTVLSANVPFIQDRLNPLEAKSKNKLSSSADMLSPERKGSLSSWGREFKIAFGPGKIGFTLNGNKVLRVTPGSQALYKGVEVGMLLVSINERRAIDDSEANLRMIEEVQKDPNGELVLRFIKQNADAENQGNNTTIKKGRSMESLMTRGYNQRRHSTDTIQFSQKNPYLQYIKSVAEETLAAKRRSRTNSFANGLGILVPPSSDDDPSPSITLVSPVACTEEDLDANSTSVSMSRGIHSGRRVATDSEFGFSQEETFIVVYPMGVQMTQDVADTSTVLATIPQGSKVVSEGKIGRRIYISYDGKKGWASQYRPDAVPLMIAVQRHVRQDFRRDVSSSSTDVHNFESDMDSQRRLRPTSTAFNLMKNDGDPPSRLSADEGTGNTSKWVKWLKKKMGGDVEYKIGDRVRMRRRTRKLQAGQIGTVATGNRDENGNWFVDFISLSDEVERWALPTGLIQPVKEAVDEVLVIQFQPDRKVGMAFNEDGEITQVTPDSQAGSKGVEVGNTILRVNGLKNKKGQAFLFFKPHFKNNDHGLPIVVEFLLT